MRLRWRLGALAVVLAVEAAALVWLAGAMSPVQPGSSAEFWNQACDVVLDRAREESRWWGGVFPPRDGWYVYYIQGYHGQFLHRVRRSTAIADYPEVLQKLTTADRSPRPDRAFSIARRLLEEDAGELAGDPDLLLARIREAILLELERTDSSGLDREIAEEAAFDRRWSRARRYWVNLAFEAVFFAGLTVFAFWPWLRRLRPWRSALHVGLLPFLLFAPWYLGYCGWTFTSAGPSGGVLYPWVVGWMRASAIWTAADSWILEHCPRPLETISQPLGSMLSVSGGAGLGPLATVALGVALGISTWAGLRLRERRQAGKCTA